MLKRLIFCLWILLPFSLFAQNEEESSTAHDSLSTEKHQGAFMKAIKKFLNFNDFDTTYISPNRYNYALMLDHFTNYEYYSVGTAAPEPPFMNASDSSGLFSAERGLAYFFDVTFAICIACVL